MKKRTAFVLSGGGARGALQVGALQALIEAGITADILVGTSIGAANSAFLALSGFNEEAIGGLRAVYRHAAIADLLPQKYVWLTLRTFFNRPSSEPSQRIREFFVAHGLVSELKFKDIQNVSLRIVSTDLNNGKRVIYGNNLDDSVLEAVLASTAIPPWVVPIQKEGQLLIDGGVISNLPIEAALSHNVSEIIALDVSEYREYSGDAEGRSMIFDKFINTVQHRQLELEMALADACHVEVKYVHLFGIEPVPVWDFRSWEELIQRGYDQTRKAMTRWKSPSVSWWPKLVKR